MRGSAQYMMAMIEGWLLAGGIFVAFTHVMLGLINPQYLALNWSLAFAIAPMPRRLFVLMVKEGPQLKQPILYVIARLMPLFVVVFATMLMGTWFQALT